jgi:hypothetical protein
MVHNVGVSEPSIYTEPHSDSPMEYLDAGAPERPRRKARPWAPIVAAAVTFLVVVVGVGIVGGDWVSRNLEMRQLVTQIEVSEQAMASTQVDVADAIQAFQDKTNPTDSDRTTLETALKAAAAKGLTGVTNGGDLVQAVRVSPWHKDIKAPTWRTTTRGRTTWVEPPRTLASSRRRRTTSTRRSPRPRRLCAQQFRGQTCSNWACG